MPSKTARCLLLLACAVLLPLYAQSNKPVPPGTATQTVGTNPATGHPAPKADAAAGEGSLLDQTVRRGNVHPGHTAAKAKSKTRVAAAAAGEGSLLDDAQGKAMLSPAAWRIVASEAMTRANKLYAAASASGNATARKAAREARSHVREMRDAAMKGDADGAKAHAGMALPYVVQLLEWSEGPAK